MYPASRTIFKRRVLQNEMWSLLGNPLVCKCGVSEIWSSGDGPFHTGHFPESVRSENHKRNTVSIGFRRPYSFAFLRTSSSLDHALETWTTWEIQHLPGLPSTKVYYWKPHSFRFQRVDLIFRAPRGGHKVGRRERREPTPHKVHKAISGDKR